MELVAFTLENYRRFRERSSLKMPGRMVALIGPNEAGKSSVLDALSRLGDDEPYLRSEIPRRSGLRPRLEWQFLLESEDLKALQGIPEFATVRKAIVTKEGTGLRTWKFHPDEPSRDTAPTDRLASGLRSLPVDVLVEWDGIDDLNADIEAVLETLDAPPQVLTDENRELLESFAQTCREWEGVLSADEDMRALSKPFKTAVADIRRVSEAFEIVHPKAVGVEVLNSRLPEFVYFTQEERELASEYDIEEVADDPPRPLYHLAQLANLDLVALRDEVRAAASADIGSRRNDANRELIRVFSQAWNQQGIALQFEIQGTNLIVHADAPGDGQLSDLEERSEGMRWFAAMLAFVHGWGMDTILLADEVETHLHYDAQSDLIKVLSTQQFTSKVIYSTHSFGCLPNDLGVGVRAVEQTSPNTSRINGDFWRSGSGFAPLMKSLGAVAATFTPSRYAVVGEGACEAILLPTLLRSASGVSELQFQVVPGLSIVASTEVRDLDSQAGHTAYLVDGDAAGDSLRKKLIGANVGEDRIVQLRDETTGSAYEIEDLINAEKYLRAVYAEIESWQALGEDRMLHTDLPTAFRGAAVSDWCSEHGIKVPDKAAVAQRVVDDDTLDEAAHSFEMQGFIVRIKQDLERVLGLPTEQ